jgi:hypothetical protein
MLIVNKVFIKRSPVRFCLLILAPVLVLAFTAAGTARASSHLLEIEGGTTDNFSDTGHMAVSGIVNTSGTTVKELNITIAYEDNFAIIDGFICTLTNPADLVISGGAPVESVTLTISATGDTCFRTTTPATPVPNVANSLNFRGYIIGNKITLASTGSTLKDGQGDIVSNVALSGEVDPSGSGSTQATGDRLIEAGGGALDLDDFGSPSGHIALAGLIRLNPLTHGATIGTARTLDVTIDYEDHSAADHLACHLTTPGDVSYTLVKGVGTLTLTVGSAGECTGVNNTGKNIVFALYVGGAKGRIVSKSSTLVDFDLDRIEFVTAVGEFSTAGGF